MKAILLSILILIISGCEQQDKKAKIISIPPGNDPVVNSLKSDTIGKVDEAEISDSAKIEKKTIVAKFLEARVLEGAGSYKFEDTQGKIIYFSFDNYDDQKIRHNFFDGEALTNEEYINSTFKVEFVSKWEIRGESEDKTLVNKIVNIELLKTKTKSD